MIRREIKDDLRPDQWLLVTQVAHAQLSHRLAEAWRGLLGGAPDAVQSELLAAVLHHDDGWQDWGEAPGFDPDHARPYDFTEMPPASAQEIWSRSIDACRAIGPLAAWVVSGHFVALQSKHDDDYPDWAPWIAAQDAQRGPWLETWLAQNAAHTRALADRCLFLLQTFDWLSLWLCCRASAGGDEGATLDLADADQSFGPFRFSVDAAPPFKAESTLVTVDPWPFVGDDLWLDVEALCAPADRYLHFGDLRRVAKPVPVAWTLHLRSFVKPRSLWSAADDDPRAARS